MQQNCELTDMCCEDKDMENYAHNYLNNYCQPTKDNNTKIIDKQWLVDNNIQNYACALKDLAIAMCERRIGIQNIFHPLFCESNQCVNVKKTYDWCNWCPTVKSQNPACAHNVCLFLTGKQSFDLL